MTALKTRQSNALAALVALLTEAATGLRKVYPDPPDSLITPCLVIGDSGLKEERAGQWRIIEWDLALSAYVAIKPTLLDAHLQARDIRADLIDTLASSITIGGTVTNTYWREGLRITGLSWGSMPEDGGAKYVGVVGTYVLVIQEAWPFA